MISAKNFLFLLRQQFLDNLDHMLNTSIKNVPNLIKISLSIVKISYLMITHILLSAKLCDSPTDLLFSMYYY